MYLLKKTHQTNLALCFAFIAAVSSSFTQATIVQFETGFGNFEVNLYDNDTPETVSNFLDYVNAGDYSDSVIHRSIDGFVIQGGGFTYDAGLNLNANNLPLNTVSSNAAVANEPIFSNVRGTIAMAKLSSSPNSATNQWFFNLADNSLNLDRQNEGFTVFGEVVGNGMDIIDQIVAVQIYDFGGAFTTIPLQSYTVPNTPDDNNLIFISNIQITDTTVDSAAGLNPPLNIGPASTPPPPSSSSGGGTISWLLFGLLLINTRRKKI